MDKRAPPKIIPAWLCKAQITKVIGGTVDARPGVDGNELPQVGKIIVAELKLRRKMVSNRQRTPDGHTPTEWLRATLYGVILSWRAYEDGDEIDSRVPAKIRNSSAIQQDPAALFHYGISAVLASHPGITASERARLAEPMWHAFRHYIPPELLLGFNHQYSAHRKQSSAVLGQIEKPLWGWVKEQRLYSLLRECPLDTHRGRYPTPINAVVEDAIAQIEQDDGPLEDENYP
jgi:hypothetical protein